MELWEVLELLGDPGFTDPRSSSAGGTIGLGTYPIFDEAHRPILNEKIIERYWDREIGMETISKFQLAMKRKMNELMRFYNQLYETELINYPALSTFGLTTTRNDTADTATTRDGTSHVGNDSSSASRSQQSNTPQNELPDGWEENADYATGGNASQAKSNGTADTTSTDTENGRNTLNGVTTTTGYQGAASDLIGKFRNQVLNLDVSIVDAVNGLFMGIWDNGEEMRPAYPVTLFGVSSTVFRPITPDAVPDLVQQFDQTIGN